MSVPEGKPSDLLSSYDPGLYFDELFGSMDLPAEHTALIRQRLAALDFEELRRRAQDAERELYNLGITFIVYSDKDAVDRILPFDVIPRVISAPEWSHLEAGVKQRVAALNLFLHDIYHDQKILRDGIIPRELVEGNHNFRPQMIGLDVPFDTYIHIMGTDLVRDRHGTFRVLEDNGRVPSGVSYVVENRHMMQRVFPDLMQDIGIRPVDNYGHRLLDAMVEIAPQGVDDPQVVLLSPGTYNSAYFEHIFLAREMGVPLVEGRDLVVENDRVYMKTTNGLAPVHSIYRRLDDAFLDPQAFNPDSLLGVPGILEAYRKGNVALANAIGTGVADDKAVYCYVPRMIKYYLDQDPIIPNVDTRICREDDALQYTLDHLSELVVKPVGEAGGYGITIGPRASKAELEDCRAKLLADPANYISQPVVDLSVCPTVCDDAIEPRHVDLRPFAITGKSTWVLPGGLSRVALKKGTLIVNSSQGGGSKDTWVLEGGAA
ncbi:putative circularly permuted ATP-grasp superfamily protein [Azospirillum picis]|uniref:Circularly permuted ATP-grasp superfamily protein n=2 Tax=Azospirillum picis TaxID=488438 RepID=A0ABU0MRP9_9PROT|nr:putative circularly permuted ATP-grasp superfamily protein [Azospirillum picis]MDQ0536156.1 putative circularly permuted ATP-grasp superfamily protein [Azospirillum picis]